jgi:hypothetical protein
LAVDHDPAALAAVARDERGFATVSRLIEETARAKTIVLDVPAWAGHIAGQNGDVRLTAEDGYQAERSYAIASAPQSAKVALTVERIDDGEVSSHLTGRCASQTSWSCAVPSAARSPGALTMSSIPGVVARRAEHPAST